MDDETESMSEEGGAGETAMDDDPDVEHYDISLAATHSYMGDGTAVSGRSVLEPGWTGVVPALTHNGIVFPGETVPLLMLHESDAAVLMDTIKKDKLFGILCPNSNNMTLSGYGVLCEIYETGVAPSADFMQNSDSAYTFKAKAVYRIRLKHMAQEMPTHLYIRPRKAEVVVLREDGLADPLRVLGLPSLDRLRNSQHTSRRVCVRRVDAALSAWPRFLLDLWRIDKQHVHEQLQQLATNIQLDKLPSDPTALSFWVSANVPLPACKKLRLLAASSAALRIKLALAVPKSLLCCVSCGAEVSRRSHVITMSSDGVASHYTNPGGYRHDIITVCEAGGALAGGAGSAEFSWFPGYRWTAAVCTRCHIHLGWRFDAMSPRLRPQRFFGLCQNYVQPRDDSDSDDEQTIL